MAPPKLLFVCVHNAGRSQMAAAFARRLGGCSIEAYSAGSRPAAAIHPMVVEAMRERGIPLRGRPKGVADLPSGPFDVMVTMGCGDVCPTIPAARRVDWAIPDPAGRPLDIVRVIRDQVEQQVRALLQTLNR